MSLPQSREVVAVWNQAKDIARRADRRLSSAHLLLALYTVPNRAALFLQDQEITVDALLSCINRYPEEPEKILERIQQRSRRLAEGSLADCINSLHLLASLVRESTSHAYRLFEDLGCNIGTVRAAVMGYATGSRALPFQMESIENEEASAGGPLVQDQEQAPSPIAIHPSLGGWRPPDGSTQTKQEVFATATTVERLTIKPPPDLRRSAAPKTTKSQEELSQEALAEARKTAKRLADNLFRKRQATLLEKKVKEESAKDEKAQLTAKVTRETAAEPSVDPKEEVVLEQEDPCGSTGPGEEGEPFVPSSRVLAERYRLDPDLYPTLVKFGRNLTEEAALHLVDNVIGRTKEIDQLIDVLGKRRGNNPLVVGEPGIGKTALVEGLAREFVNLGSADNDIGKRAIIELSLGRIVGGTHLRGAFAERLQKIKEEVKHAQGDIIVFLDEIHRWLAGGTTGDGSEAAAELKTALARGDFPCIGATTNREFRKFVEVDPAFERRFQLLFVDEPSPEEAIEILQGTQEHYEEHHGVEYEPEALEAAVRLSMRFMHERRLPDKAIGVIDLAGSRAARKSEDRVSAETVARIVAEVVGLPPERLTADERSRFLAMEDELKKSIIGHDETIETTCDLIRRNYAGFRSQRPIGSVLLLGPTGVGKTELVKAIADFLFFDRDALVRLDMSEFSEAHSVSRLIGAPPGYVGFEQGGQLTEAVRKRPYQIILFDEVEKAHPEVLNVLLQLLDEGQLTDGQGRKTDFSNTFVAMTSNAGAERVRLKSGARIGFDGQQSSRKNVEEGILSAAKKIFALELWNRIDERLVFLPLTKEEVQQIGRMLLADVALHIRNESDIHLEFSDDVAVYLAEHGGYDPQLGARPMRQTITRLIEGQIAKQILLGELGCGDMLTIRTGPSGDSLEFTPAVATLDAS